MNWAKKKQKALTKKLGKARKAGEKALENAVASANASNTNQGGTTAATTTTNHRLNTAAGPVSSSQQQQSSTMDSFMNQLNLASSSFQQGLANMSQYDYKMETTVNKLTGATTTKVTTTHKETGKIVSSHEQVEEIDGSVRVKSSGSWSAGGGSSVLGPDMSRTSPGAPPGLPATGDIEYTMEGSPDTEMKMVCTVKNGPEAGKVIEYNVRDAMNDSSDDESTPTYQVVRIRNPQRQRRWIMAMVLALLVAVVSIVLAGWEETVLDVICMPTPPGMGFDCSSFTSLPYWEAPWWSPDVSKASAFSMICPNRPRTALQWTAKGKKCSLEVFTERKRADKVTTLMKTEFVKYGLQSARVFPSQLSFTSTNDKVESLPGPWQSKR